MLGNPSKTQFEMAKYFSEEFKHPVNKELCNCRNREIWLIKLQFCYISLSFVHIGITILLNGMIV